MGDRALIQFKAGSECSPVVYLHWSGEEVPALLRKTRALMAERYNDLNYVAARFIGVCHEADPGNLSLGVWNQAKGLTEEDSHGDAGCFIANVAVSTWPTEAFGGYGASMTCEGVA